MKKYFIIALFPFILFSCAHIVTMENGMKFYADSYLYQGATTATDGKTRDYAYFTLAGDFTLPNGMVLKKDTRCTVNRAVGGGALIKCTLAKNWKHPDFGFIIKAGLPIDYYDSGEMHLFYLAADWLEPKAKIVFAAGSRVTFYTSGAISSFFPAFDVPVPNSTMIIKKGTQVVLYENGSYSSLILAQDYSDPAGYVMKGGTVIQFYKTGEIKKATFAKPWQNPLTGIRYEAGKEYSF